MPKNKEEHGATAAATAPEQPTEETPVVETPTVEQPETAQPAETPAAAEIDNAALAAQIANAEPGAVQTTTVTLPKGAAALKGDRKRIAHKLGGLAALLKELNPEIIQMLHTESKTMKSKERDYWFNMIKNADVIGDIALEGVGVLCGEEPKRQRD